LAAPQLQSAQENDMRRAVEIAGVFQTFSAAALLLLITAGTVTAQQQPPVVTHPNSSSVQATPRSTGSSRGGSAAAAQTNIKVGAGTITGFVYWDMSAAQYKLSAPCQGLTVSVSTISKPQAGGGQVLATTNHLTPTGPMTNASAPGAPRYMLCSYSFRQIPVGEYLRVQATVAVNTFSAGVSIQNPPDFEIFGGTCNNTPQGTLSFILTGGEMVCGNNAYNINLKLYTSGSPSRGMLPAGSGPLLHNTSGAKSSGDGTLKLRGGTGGGTTSAGGTTGATASPSPRAANSPKK
jgi:hypothetical protein